MEVGRGAKGNVIHHTPLVQEMRDARCEFNIHFPNDRVTGENRNCYGIKLISFTVVM